MPIEQNKAVIRRYYEEFGNQKRLEVADEIFAPEFRVFPDSDPPYGPEGAKGFMQWMWQYEGLTATIDGIVAEGDQVATLVTLRARQTIPIEYLPEFGVIPASGKPYALQEFILWRVRDGKIVERQVVIDQLDLLRQIGFFAPKD